MTLCSICHRVPVTWAHLREHHRAGHARRARESFKRFVSLAWSIVEPAVAYQSNTASVAIIRHLQAVADGEIKRLCISVPPGSGKSTLTCVLFPAWMWSRRPEWRAIFASHAHSFASRDSRRTRRLIESQWYLELFRPSWAMRDDQNRQDDFENTASGRRMAVGFDSAVTGQRANALIVDDPLKAIDAHSDASRATMHEIFDATLSTRLDKPDDAPIIVVQQRLDDDDLIGRCLKRGYVDLRLPAEFEPDRRTVTPVWEDPRQVEGELLCPTIHSAAYLAEQRIVMGSHGYGCQYRQRPESIEGGLFKMPWFRVVDSVPRELTSVCISLDANAKKTTGGSRAALLTIGRLEEPKRIVLDAWARSEELPALVQAIRDMHGRCVARRWRVEKLIVEEAALGNAVIQTMREELAALNVPIEGIKPGNDKYSRAHAVLPIAESGNVSVLRGPWTDDFLHELCSFPNAKRDDYVDSFTQCLDTMRGEIHWGCMTKL